MITQKSVFFGLLAAAVLLVNSAGALSHLPDSTYADAVGNWQGWKVHDEDDGFSVWIEYTVYYNGAGAIHKDDEEDLVDLLNLEGDFIYMYQIFNYDPELTDNITSFSVLGLDDSPMEGRTMDDTGAYQDIDDVEAIEPDDYPSEGVWTFGGFGLGNDQHSWFMMFSSDSAPTKGTYELNPAETDMGAAPEPGTLTLLGIGAAMLVNKRKRYA